MAYGGCHRLDQLFTRLLTPNTAIDVMQGFDPRVYAAMLDSRRIDSCAYWQQASSLDQA